MLYVSITESATFAREIGEYAVRPARQTATAFETLG
jgi:hypothetical protein